jgi:methionyl-tRNA formyltransferase
MVTSGPLRIVFFGTPAFAVPTLEALLGSRHSLIAVVTQPDRPRGRGLKTMASPVKAHAIAAGVPILQPHWVKDTAFTADLSALSADMGIVAAYGQILTQTLLDTPRLGMLNVHASILPHYRGAAPVHRSIINGDGETGITIMRMVKALDAGPMLAVARRSIASDETSEEVERDLARMGARLLLRAIDEALDGRANEIPQNESEATYAPRLTKDDGRIDWGWPATRVHNLIRGLHPWPHAVTFLGPQRFILHRSRASSEPAGAPPGTILDAGGDRLRVATGDGVIDIVEIQTEGKRPMPVREFLAGHSLAAGAILHAPL